MTGRGGVQEPGCVCIYAHVPVSVRPCEHVCVSLCVHDSFPNPSPQTSTGQTGPNWAAGKLEAQGLG